MKIQNLKMMTLFGKLENNIYLILTVVVFLLFILFIVFLYTYSNNSFHLSIVKICMEILKGIKN